MKGNQQDLLPPGVGWELPPSKPSSTERPGWALPFLVAGLICSLVVAWISAQYSIGQAQGDAPSQAMVYMLAELPLLIVGLPLLLLGSLGAVRPWTHGRAWLWPAVVGGAIAWFLVAVAGPSLLFAKTETLGSGSVGGLPGQQAVWSGIVQCTGTQETGLEVVAKVPASVLSRENLATSRDVEAVALATNGGTAYEVQVDITGDPPEIFVLDGGFGTGLPGATVDVEPDGLRGTIVSKPGSILHTDDPPSVVTLTWDCGIAP